MFGLNRNQWLGIVIAIIGGLAGASAQLTEIFGTTTAHTIVSVCGLLNTLLGTVVAIVTGQSGMVQQVLAMPGVENVQVNANANKSLAAMAMDPAQSKVEAAPGAEEAVKKTAGEV